mmetsp:Transcript_2490/g.8450  ORF Transcript_2490/g.8450 Transcript_2490/m.8450 type:complete len:575 (+) Transcript_2490:142-1866(+)
MSNSFQKSSSSFLLIFSVEAFGTALAFGAGAVAAFGAAAAAGGALRVGAATGASSSLALPTDRPPLPPISSKKSSPRPPQASATAAAAPVDGEAPQASPASAAPASEPSSESPQPSVPGATGPGVGAEPEPAAGLLLPPRAMPRPGALADDAACRGGAGTPFVGGGAGGEAESVEAEGDEEGAEVRLPEESIFAFPMEPMSWLPTTEPTVLIAQELQPASLLAAPCAATRSSAGCPALARRSSICCLTICCRELSTVKAVSATLGSGSTSLWQTPGSMRVAISSHEKSAAHATSVCNEAIRQGAKGSLKPAPSTVSRVWLATALGTWLEILPEQITAFVRMDASGSCINFTSNLTTRPSTVFGLSLGTKKIKDFTVASRMGPLESVKPFTHSGKILSLIMASSRWSIISPMELSSLNRMARSGHAKSWATKGATFSLNSSSFNRMPIFRIEGSTWAASWPGNFCASKRSGKTCLVCNEMGTESNKPGRFSKKTSFSFVDLMCKLPRKHITRMEACCWKNSSCSNSAMGLLPRSGPGLAKSAKGLRSSGGRSWEARVMSIRKSVPLAPVFADPKT